MEKNRNSVAKKYGASEETLTLEPTSWAQGSAVYN